MPPKGTKRTAATSSGGGGSGAGRAKAPKGRAGKPLGNPPKARLPTKAVKPKTPSSGTSVGSSGAPGTSVYAVKCSRATRVAFISEEALTDQYGDETNEAAELINKKAVRMDGTWFWSGPGSRAPKKGPAPGLVVYRCKAAANKAGEEAWAELMQGHPFDCRVAGNDVEHDDGGSDADPDDFKNVAPGGRAAWVRREKFLYCPHNEGTPNIVSSKAKVEVVEVVVR